MRFWAGKAQTKNKNISMFTADSDRREAGQKSTW
jgi:hypothetical protein